MGKNYKKELEALNIIYDEAMNADVDVIARFLKENLEKPFIGVGSGGSYSVASAMKYLCRKAGILGDCVTPLELCDLLFSLKETAIMLFTAGGSNNDSKNAYQYLSLIEPQALLTCCMRKDAPIKKLQQNNLHEFYYEYQMPIAKDGYLAVESYVSSIVLLIRAFEHATQDAFYALDPKYEWNKEEFDNKVLKNVLKRESIIVLHGGITTPAAVDLESKFSEVSLGNISLVDFRNFAHGRHFWLSDRRDSTGIIALVGKDEKNLADKTLGLLPENIPVLRKDVTSCSVNGMIGAIEFVLKLVLEAGNIKGIDPGHPKIEEFGKKLYHINYNICNTDTLKTLRKDCMKAGIYRKLAIPLSQVEESVYKIAEERYTEILSRRYKGIIFDYDGTLHDKRHSSELEDNIFVRINELLGKGIVIGIATGRGKSVRTELQRVIQEKYWNKVAIAYYNGGVVGTLDDVTQPNKLLKPFPEDFSKVQRYIEETNRELKVDGIEDHNPYQLTIMSVDRAEINRLRVFIEINTPLKILSSSHSIDIIPQSSSKNNIFKWYESKGFNQKDFLLLGDSGHESGNDYELLMNPYGLSVDTVGKSLDSCWNFAPMGRRNLEATQVYLNWIEVWEDGCFTLGG